MKRIIQNIKELLRLGGSNVEQALSVVYERELREELVALISDVSQGVVASYVDKELVHIAKKYKLTGKDIVKLLEGLKGKDKLSMQAIKGLLDRLEEIESIARHAGGGGGGSNIEKLDDIGDVDVTGASNGQVLTFNGVSWVANDATGGIDSVIAGDGLTGGGSSGDVTVSLDESYTDARYVKKSGDTMTGALILAGSPTVDNGASTKEYVDTGLNSKSDVGHGHASSDISDFHNEVQADSHVSDAYTHASITDGNPHGITYDRLGNDTASNVTLDTSNFNGNLSSSDDTVQKAIDTLDDLEVIDDHAMLSNLTWSNAGHTIDTDVDFTGYKAIALVCDNGSVLPTSPKQGQWFLHTPTGRNVLMMYSGTEWLPMMNIGETELYVDSANGTDDTAYGGSNGTGAFKTIQYAINSLAGTIGGDVVIHIASGTYDEEIVVNNKSFTGVYSIRFTAEWDIERTSTAVKSASVGSTTVNASVNLNATLTTNQYEGMFLRFTDTTSTVALQGKVYQIYQNDNTVGDSKISIVGTFETGFGVVPTTSDIFEVVSPSVEITKNITVTDGQQGIEFEHISFHGVTVVNWAGATFTNCVIDRSPDVAYAFVSISALADFIACYFHATSSSVTARLMFITSYSTVTYSRCYLDGAGITTNGYLIDISSAFGYASSNSVVLDGKGVSGIKGMQLKNNGITGNWSTGVPYPLIRNCGTGIYAWAGGGATNSTSSRVVYSGNTTDTSASSTTYGFIT